MRASPISSTLPCLPAFFPYPQRWLPLAAPKITVAQNSEIHAHFALSLPSFQCHFCHERGFPDAISASEKLVCESTPSLSIWVGVSYAGRTFCMTGQEPGAGFSRQHEGGRSAAPGPGTDVAIWAVRFRTPAIVQEVCPDRCGQPLHWPV